MPEKPSSQPEGGAKEIASRTWSGLKGLGERVGKSLERLNAKLKPALQKVRDYMLKNKAVLSVVGFIPGGAAFLEKIIKFTEDALGEKSKPSEEKNDDSSETSKPKSSTGANESTEVSSSGIYKSLYNKHKELLSSLSVKPAQNAQLQAAIGAIKHNWSRYKTVEKATGLPAALIAGIHYREASFSFNTKFHNGEALHIDGTVARQYYPYVKPFKTWEESAIHAINTMKKRQQEGFGLTATSKDLGKMAAFAEMYNGLGYHNKNLVSPYVYGGTNKYEQGMYVADGKFNANVSDKRLGVIPIVQALLDQ